MIKPTLKIVTAALSLILAACGEDNRQLSIAEETPDPDEAAITRDLIELTKRASEEARNDALEEDPAASQVLRFNQPRHVGCVKADFKVEPNLPTELQVGLFGTSQTFPAWLRFANATNAPDTKKDFRGMSIKVMQVQGEKLLGSDSTQDFVLNSHPVLFVGKPEDFRDFVDYNVKTSPLLFFFNPFDLHIKELNIVRAGRQHHPGHLVIPYWSTTPYLFGAGQAVKYAAKPCNRNDDIKAPKNPTDGYLRTAMRKQLANGSACFDFMVQFQTDAELMPIEDATVEWEESVSPFLRVAQIQIPAQSFESDEQMEFCENLAFNPWRSLPEHRPLGGLNRVRKDLYQTLSDFRHEANGVTYTEPTDEEPF